LAENVVYIVATERGKKNKVKKDLPAEQEMDQ
jgi:hypothetical protein